MVDKRKSSDYGTLRGLVPQNLIKQFKVFCLENNLDNSEGLEKILADYFKQLESQNLPHGSTLEQLAMRDRDFKSKLGSDKEHTEGKE